MATTSPSNPLLSSHPPSDVQVVLHPLVLLTISDYITRHTLREQVGPILGALLGQNNGREITIEHAFECNTLSAGPSEYKLDSQRFASRLEQFKIVHKDRKLDFVGWYTLTSRAGPTPSLLPTHTEMLAVNDSALLLAFHPDDLANLSVGAKLPLTIYESNYEVDDEDQRRDDDGDDKKMQEGGADGAGADPSLKLKFRELSYTVEAGDAEMISMDFVARGGANATAVEQAKDGPSQSQSQSQVDPTSGRKRGAKRRNLGIEDKDAPPADPAEPVEVELLPEEEEMIGALTAKANAIKMLQSRIQVLHKYLDQLPESYKSGADPYPQQAKPQAAATEAGGAAPPSNVILRQVQALVQRLELVVPSDEASFSQELLRERNDVGLLSLLSGIVENAGQVRGMGHKMMIIESGKSRKKMIPDYGPAMAAAGIPSMGRGEFARLGPSLGEGLGGEINVVL